MTTLPKIIKALFIYENLPSDAELDTIEPFLLELFRYTLDKLKTIYGMYHHSRDNSALARHASRTLDMFCDSKPSSIPYIIKAMCILNTTD